MADTDQDREPTVAEIAPGATCSRCNSSLDGRTTVFVSESTEYDESGTFCSAKCREEEEAEAVAYCLRTVVQRLHSKHYAERRSAIRAEIEDKLERLRLYVTGRPL